MLCFLFRVLTLRQLLLLMGFKREYIPVAACYADVITRFEFKPFFSSHFFALKKSAKAKIKVEKFR